MPNPEKMKKFYDVLLQADSFLSFQYLADELQVSVKTVYNYSKEQDFQISNFNIILERKKHKGIRLVGSEKEKTRFRNSLFQDSGIVDSSITRRKELLESLLMYDEKVSVRKLEETYHVAKSSIVNDLEYVDKQLQKNKLFLVRDKSGTYIGGKEQHIRSAKRNYVYELLKEKITAKESYDLNACKEILSRYVNEHHLFIAGKMIDFISAKFGHPIGDDVYYNQIFIQLSIFLDRIEKYHFLVTTTYRPVVSELHNLKTFPVTVELSQWLASEYKIQLKDQDIRWLNARVSGVYHESDLITATNKTVEITKTLYEFIETISMIVGENLLEDKILMKGLEQHLVPMFNRITNKISISNPFLTQIKSQYPALFSILVLATSTFENNFGMHLSDDEISFILIHFQAAIERLNLSKKIAIIINNSGAIADLVENRVKRNLPRFDVVETFNLEDLNFTFLSEFDFIISTMPIAYKGKPCLMISPLVDEIDVRKIRKIYSELDVQPNVNIRDILIENVDDHSLFLKKRFESRMEVLLHINKVLLEEGYVCDGFFESMMQREELSPTEMGNGFAIPHGISKYVKKEKIVIITLEKPILWEQHKVDVIICLAINFADKERSRKLISNIYHIIKSSDAVQKIRMCTSKEAFIDLVRNL